MFEPRPYQLDAHTLLVEEFKAKRDPLLLMATGLGKSKTIVSFIEKYLHHYNWVLCVRKRNLVKQLAKDLDLFKLDFGVYMGGDKRYSPRKQIQLCSIDTIFERGSLPHIDDSKDVVVIIDEADETNSDQYQDVIKSYKNRTIRRRSANLAIDDTFKPLRKAFLVGLTATAYDEALPHFDSVIEPIKPKKARDMGYLCDYRYFIPVIKDMKNVEIVNGSYSGVDLDREFNTQGAIKNDFEAWLTHGDDRQTLVFCCNILHARNFAKYINMYYGMELAIAIDSESPEEYRETAIEKFRNGVIRFLINVRLITRGTDIDIIGTILDCAPTLKVNHHIQKLGRGSRINPLYKDCILIDCANNLSNGGFYRDRAVDLKNGVPRRLRMSEEMIRRCSKCFRAAEPSEFLKPNNCPFCNHYNGKVIEPKISKAKEEKLFYESASEEQIEQNEIIKEYRKKLWQYQNLPSKKYLGMTKSEKEAATKIDAQIKMLEKHGLEKVMRVKKTLDLKDEAVRRWDQRYSYKPLGGMM